VRRRYLNRKDLAFDGENVTGADNQQERLDASWVVGFTDGEGCFYVGINRPKGYTQVLPEFRIVQHKRDKVLLEQIRSFFGYGSVTINHGNIKELRIRGLENLNKLVLFFRQHPLKSKKQKAFEKFAEIIDLMNERRHLTRNGVVQICNLAEQMNRQLKRNLESSETTR
jgi:hypothetical protein